MYMWGKENVDIKYIFKCNLCIVYVYNVFNYLLIVFINNNCIK